MRSFNEYLSQRKWTRTSLALWVGGVAAAATTIVTTGTVQDVSAFVMLACWGLYGGNVALGFRTWKREEQE
jgi:uncharacterized membrane protein YidH (DUF202 family)